MSPAPSTPTFSICCAIGPPLEFSGLRRAAYYALPCGGCAVAARSRRRSGGCRLKAHRHGRFTHASALHHRQEATMSIVFSEDHGRARHVVLNRPEKRNAMSQELLLALGDALPVAAADSSVHCVVLRGEGPVFSAGVDLVELAESAGTPGMLRPFRNGFLECANFCEEMAKPVVCQIHRTCVGGALEVALGCDLRIASSDAQLGLPEVK